MNNAKEHNLSRWDIKIIDLARKETDPRFVERFLPITRGPILAVLGFVIVGLMAALCLFLGKLLSFMGIRRD